MRSSAHRRRLLTPQSALREDLDRFTPSRGCMNMNVCRWKLNSAFKPCLLDASMLRSGQAAGGGPRLVLESHTAA
jgi:hypothetical protein